MSQYNKTVLTHAGLELAKRANAGQAKFGITRAVTSADDWSHKTVQDLEEVTTIPNIMQQGTIMDTDEVESNNSVIGVSLCFTNKNLSTGYQIRVIGLYVKEEGQENDFLYAVTTAITPESMPSFADKVLYKFNMQMYLVIGNAQSVNVVINEGTAVTSTQFDKYKGEVADNLKKLENTHKEDMSHVAKSASVNGGAEILPNEAGKLELVVPDPDLSKYVSLEQLTEMLQGKADITAVPNKTDTEEGIRQAKAAAKAADDKAQSALDSKANSSDVYTKTESDGRFARSTTVNGLIIKTDEIESGVINNTRTIRILSHDDKSLATHANETITARTEYIKTDSTLSDYGAVANAGKVGEAIKQTFLILNASIARLVVDYNSLQSNQVIVDLTNKVLALKDQNDEANRTIQALKKSVEITSAESQKDNLDALHDTGRYYLGEAKGFSDAVLEVATLGNTNKIMQYIYSAGNNPNRAERRIGTKNGNTYSWSGWSAEY